MARRFPSTCTVEQIPGGFKVLDANGQSLAYGYGCETKGDADAARVLTMDEARRIASNIAKLPSFLTDNYRMTEACPYCHGRKGGFGCAINVISVLHLNDH